MPLFLRANEPQARHAAGPASRAMPMEASEP